MIHEDDDKAEKKPAAASIEPSEDRTEAQVKKEEYDGFEEDPNSLAASIPTELVRDEARPGAYASAPSAPTRMDSDASEDRQSRRRRRRNRSVPEEERGRLAPAPDGTLTEATPIEASLVDERPRSLAHAEPMDKEQLAARELLRRRYGKRLLFALLAIAVLIGLVTGMVLGFVGGNAELVGEGEEDDDEEDDDNDALEDDEVPEVREIIDIDEFFADTSRRAFHVAIWGTTTNCELLDMAPLSLTCENGFIREVAADNAWCEDQVDPHELVCHARRQVDEVKEGVVLLECAGLMEDDFDLPVVATVMNETVADCSRTASIDVDWPGGEAATYVHLGRFCTDNTSWMLNTQAQCVDGQMTIVNGSVVGEADSEQQLYCLDGARCETCSLTVERVEIENVIGSEGRQGCEQHDEEVNPSVGLMWSLVDESLDSRGSFLQQGLATFFREMDLS